MAALGTPHYKKGSPITDDALKELSFDKLVYSYTAVECHFTFPDSVKYPSIPCYIDENTTVYPLKGKAILTGPEYHLAKVQGCDIKFIEAYHDPFKRGDDRNQKSEDSDNDNETS